VSVRNINTENDKTKQNSRDREKEKKMKRRKLHHRSKTKKEKVQKGKEQNTEEEGERKQDEKETTNQTENVFLNKLPWSVVEHEIVLKLLNVDSILNFALSSKQLLTKMRPLLWALVQHIVEQQWPRRCVGNLARQHYGIPTRTKPKKKKKTETKCRTTACLPRIHNSDVVERERGPKRSYGCNFGCGWFRICNEGIYLLIIPVSWNVESLLEILQRWKSKLNEYKTVENRQMYTGKAKEIWKHYHMNLVASALCALKLNGNTKQKRQTLEVLNKTIPSHFQLELDVPLVRPKYVKKSL
jgi:hypothetical protein